MNNTAMTKESVEARRAIESLRSGVPSRYAVQWLRTTQSSMEDMFQDRLEQLAMGQGVEPIVFSAKFGGGKSHLLNYFQSIAEEKGFVTSFGVTSAEMPLGKPHTLLKALVENAVAPKRVGRALSELMIDFSASKEVKYGETRLWARDAGLLDRFNALLLLYEEFTADEEFREQVLGDIEGIDTIRKAILRQRLKEINQAAGYDLSIRKNDDMAYDRLRLLAQLFKMRTSGKGWIILIDEVERLANFSRKQRLSAYEMIGWFSELAQQQGSGILPVFAMTTGLDMEVISGGKRDIDFVEMGSDNLPNETFRRRKLGIQLLQRAKLLESPTPEQEQTILYRLKSLYQEAYTGNNLPSLEDSPHRVHTTIRSEIRRWITLWDLHRYYPDYRVEVVEEALPTDTREMDDTLLEEGND
ncbi:MAG: DUF2791 family P-loop domain-containing protein [Fimbriimonadia bacterium]|nr:DUF2791 family P-loop domain-containing protein [Fimbriimonadia bacterium]